MGMRARGEDQLGTGARSGGLRRSLTVHDLAEREDSRAVVHREELEHLENLAQSKSTQHDVGRRTRLQASRGLGFRV